MIELKRISNSFHMSHKKALYLIASFSLVLSVLFLLVSVIIRPKLLHLETLVKSQYLYSALVEESNIADSYYQFDAGISFILSTTDKMSINADVVMQLDKEDYTDAVLWSAKELQSREVAISRDISREYNLEVGDLIYAKHIVTGEICDYVVKQIVPYVSAKRFIRGYSYTNGIIIMGYDSIYCDNIAYKTIIYTTNDINRINSLVEGMPTKIVYRSEEIKDLIWELLPYILIQIVLSVFIMISLVRIIKKWIRSYHKRLLTMGADYKQLNKAYYSVMIKHGSAVILGSNLLLLLTNVYLDANGIAVGCVLAIVIVEYITLLLAAAFANRQLWRQ